MHDIKSFYTNHKSNMLLVVACLLFMQQQTYASDSIEAVRAYREKNGAKILQDYAEFLSMPNYGLDANDIRKNAEYIREELSKRGVQSELFTVPNAPPVVYGRLEVPGAKRTLGVYVHYDGQPVNEKKWTNPPFTPTLYTRAIEEGGQKIPFPKDGETIDPDWRLYARASGDDKTPIQAILTVLDAFRENNITPTSNFIFFFEGEEELGSTHLKQYFLKYMDKIDADAWLICDGPMHQSRKPQLMFGVRGITAIDITVYGANRSLHSGHYGNWSPNPAMMLSQLLASMKDDEGRVIIDGFYDTVDPLSAADRAALRAIPNIDDQMRKEFGLAKTEANNTPYNDRLLLPSLNIRGLASANVGKLARNVIPSEAEAAIDIRLVKGNDPEDMMDRVEAHIRKQGYKIVREDPERATRLLYPKIAKVIRHKGYKAARTSMDVPIVKEIIRAAERASGETIIKLPSLGGSLPLYLFTDLLAKPVVITPMANHDDNQHAPDENLRIGNLWYGLDLIASLMTMTKS